MSMTTQDWITIVTTYILSLGGVGGIVFVLVKWFGKFLADKYVEKVRHEFEQDLESHKTQLRKSEFLFQKEFEAASAFISLHLRLRPREIYPEMDWYDACENFATKFNQIEKALDSYIATHGAALKAETLKHLTDVQSWVLSGQHELRHSNEGIPVATREARQYAENVIQALEEIEKELYQTVRSQSTT